MATIYDYEASNNSGDMSYDEAERAANFEFENAQATAADRAAWYDQDQ